MSRIPATTSEGDSKPHESVCVLRSCVKRDVESVSAENPQEEDSLIKQELEVDDGKKSQGVAEQELLI